MAYHFSNSLIFSYSCVLILILSIIIIIYFYLGDVNGCLCISEFDTEPGGFKSYPKVKDTNAHFEFQDEVLVHKAEIELRKSQIKDLTFQVRITYLLITFLVFFV